MSNFEAKNYEGDLTDGRKLVTGILEEESQVDEVTAWNEIEKMVCSDKVGEAKDYIRDNNIDRELVIEFLRDHYASLELDGKTEKMKKLKTDFAEYNQNGEIEGVDYKTKFAVFSNEDPQKAREILDDGNISPEACKNFLEGEAKNSILNGNTEKIAELKKIFPEYAQEIEDSANKMREIMEEK